VSQTLCRARSMTSPIRRKAGAPSTRGRTALPVRTGYEPMIGCGISIEVASDRNGGVAFLSFSGRHLGKTVPGQIGLAAGIP
jgi:hypothetical protein